MRGLSANEWPGRRSATLRDAMTKDPGNKGHAEIGRRVDGHCIPYDLKVPWQ